jgi:hypothetical protein
MKVGTSTYEFGGVHNSTITPLKGKSVTGSLTFTALAEEHLTSFL